MKAIRWKIKALKQLRKIKNAKAQNDIYDAVQGLACFPDCPNVKKLKNRKEYRLRVGRYRVIFTADLQIILIEEVKKRNERTY